MSALSDKIKRLEMLEIGKGVQYLLNETCKILENPIIMFDTDYRLLAHTEGIVTDDPIWNEILTNGTFCTETQELFKEEGFIDAVANAKTITFLESEKLKDNRILGKVFNKYDTHVANLVVMECEKPFEEDTPAIFEAVCKVLSKEVSINEFYQNYGKEYGESLTRKLLDGSINDKALYSAHVAILYNGLKNNLYLAVVDIDRDNPGYKKLERIKNLIAKAHPSFICTTYSDYIIMLFSTDNDSLDMKKDLSKLKNIINQRKMYAGISGCFENLYELRRYYAEALNALKSGMAKGGERRLFLHEEGCASREITYGAC